MNTNAHGLSRYIREDIKRTVRQRCGFGCVVCGCAVYQYEHILPEFSEALSHNAESITLLCGGCHDRGTRGLLAKKTVIEANENPKCMSLGFSFGAFDAGIDYPQVLLGTLRATRTRVLLQLLGDPVLSVAPPEVGGGPFLLSAFFCDRKGIPILHIVNNEWRVPTTNWDVELAGQRITIRHASRQIILQIRTEPRKRLVIEKLEMSHKGVQVSCREGKHLSVITTFGTELYAQAAEVTDCSFGINVTESRMEVGRGGTVFFENVTFNPETRPRERSVGAYLDRIPKNSIRRAPPKHNSRNQYCPCGSGRKSKKCCGAALI